MKTSISLLAAATAALANGQALPQLSGDPDSVTVSGWNTGASFACMLQIILSDTIKGAACIKGSAFGVDNSKVKIIEDSEF